MYLQGKVTLQSQYMENFHDDASSHATGTNTGVGNIRALQMPGLALRTLESAATVHHAPVVEYQHLALMQKTA